MSVTFTYFAAAKAALGRPSEQLDAAGRTIASVLDELAAGSADAATTATVLGRCSFLHNTRATKELSTVLADGDTVDVLPPFAGG